MKSIELEKKLHELNNGKYPTPNNKIVLYLDPDMSSMGVSPNIPITGIREGFDWNNGLTFLGTDIPVILKEKNRDIPRKAIQIFYQNDIVTSTLHCPYCEAQVWKGDRYCSKCGQRVDTENTEDVKI